MAARAERCGERVVLVVDDDELVRYFMVRSLAEGGFRVLVAANGDEALVLLAGLAATVWAVVSDFTMPVMDGVALAASMAERWPTIPLLMVSARPPTDWTGPFLPKPFSPPALVAAVESLLPPAPTVSPVSSLR